MRLYSFFNISTFIYIKGADDSHLNWMAITSLSAIYIHSCGVVTISLPLILSFPCLLQVYLSGAPTYVVNFIVLLLFALLMLDEILSGNGLLHSVSWCPDQPNCLFCSKASYIFIYGNWLHPLDSDLYWLLPEKNQEAIQHPGKYFLG
jgi:hypothetical protein